jgi:hypothetical protein
MTAATPAIQQRGASTSWVSLASSTGRTCLTARQPVDFEDCEQRPEQFAWLKDRTEVFKATLAQRIKDVDLPEPQKASTAVPILGGEAASAPTDDAGGVASAGRRGASRPPRRDLRARHESIATAAATCPLAPSRPRRQGVITTSRPSSQQVYAAVERRGAAGARNDVVSLRVGRRAIASQRGPSSPSQPASCCPRERVGRLLGADLDARPAGEDRPDSGRRVLDRRARRCHHRGASARGQTRSA